MRRGVVIAVAAITILRAGLIGHAGLRFSSPLEGATLGDTPVSVELTFGEQPDPAASFIQVIDTSGLRHDVGAPLRVPDNPLSLSVRVRPLGTGVYTVNWRVVSAVDGHATTGSYAFGVRASPAGSAARPTSTNVSLLEVVARGILIVGLVVLLGSACAELARFAGPRNLSFATTAWVMAACGVENPLAIAQRQTAGVSAADLAGTSIGRALIWRAAALLGAAVAIGVAWSTAESKPRIRIATMTVVAIAVLAAVAVHVTAGHAGAGRNNIAATVVAQWAHFAATGIWIGGLAALLLGIRGAPCDVRAGSVRRFSTIAAGGILVVVATGVVRAFNELTAWADLTRTGYGRALLVKVALFGVIAILGGINRWRNVSRAHRDLRPLRIVSSGELGLAAAVFAAAAVLGALPPPAAARLIPGITASGVDFATTVRVSLSAASDQPGPNRFVARVIDYDSRHPVDADRVSLRFSPLDDPGLPTTSLQLAREGDGSYAGAGANLSFDGRWRVTVGVERAGSSVDVPMDVEVRGRADPVIVSRIPGQPITYTVVVRGVATLQFSPDAERAGVSRVYVSCYDFIWDERRVTQMVATHTARGEPVRQLALKRVSAGRFVADVVFTPGRHTISAVARTTDGSRVRATVQIEIPER